jgi:putative SOS response-associated peptidase YedK
MCGRFTIAKTEAEIASRFRADVSEGVHLNARYNVAPTQDIPIILGSVSGTPRLVIMKWGFVPPWATPEKPITLINLRSDTLQSKPAFKKYLLQSRCIVPADGFYEWATEGKVKVPYRFVMKEGLFGLGGLFRSAKDKDGNEVLTCCLITTKANSVVSKVHDRMPVIISPAFESAWLNPTSLPTDYISCLAPYSPETMSAYEVSRNLNTAKNDSPDLIQPVNGKGLKEFG